MFDAYLLASLLWITAVFAPALRFKLLYWDDFVNINQNPVLRTPSFGNFSHLWRQPYFGLYVPLTYSVWAFLAELNGFLGGRDRFDPLIFHASSVLFHVVNAALVYLLLTSVGISKRASLLGSLLFGVHPIQVEAVAWVSEFRGVLSCTLALVSLVLLVKSAHRLKADHEDGGRRRSALFLYVASLSAFVLSLLSKSTSAPLPLAAMVLALSFGLADKPTLLKSLTPFAACSILFAVITSHVQVPDPALNVSPLLRPLVFLDSLRMYSMHLAWPAHLAADYGRKPSVACAPANVVASALFGIGVLCSAFFLRRRAGVVAGLCVFVALMLPTSGFVTFSYQRFSSIADRYVYLAILGPILALCELTRGLSPRAFVAYSTPLVAVLCLLSRENLYKWRDSDAFFMAAAKDNPRSLLAWSGLGGLANERGEYALALKRLTVAHSISPTYVPALLNMALAEANIPGMESASLRDAKKSIALDPTSFQTWMVAGYACGKLGDWTAAREYSQKACDLNPHSTDARRQLLWTRSKLMGIDSDSSNPPLAGKVRL